MTVDQAEHIATALYLLDFCAFGLLVGKAIIHLINGR